MMTDLLLKIGLSNACFALALAIVALVVGKTTKRPHLANLLWLLVLVKLVTPPLVTIPGVAMSGQTETAVGAEEHLQTHGHFAGNRRTGVSPSIPASGANVLAISQPNASTAENVAPTVAERSAVLDHLRQWAPPIWLLGSAIVLVWSLVRVSRFSRLLTAEAQPAPEQLQTSALRIARRLKLKTLPTICTTSARISPMVWWTGGKVRVIIPITILDRLETRQLKWVLAHELAHVKRRDYLVRWLEWLACVGFWWNPVVWWAQRNLRATEEICCDALVISSLNPKPHSYAKSILTAVESLVRPAVRPPAMASEVNSGGFLERRFKMIVSGNSNKSKSRWLQTCVLLCAMIVLPLGVASAQDLDAVWKRLQTSVDKGEISRQQAHIMMGALKGSMYKEKEDDHRDRRPDRERIDAHLREIWEKLQREVREGKMSQEDAHKKMGEIKKHIDAKHKNREHRPDGDRGKEEKVHAHLRAIWERMQHAVREGKMSKEDAERKMDEIKRQVHAKFQRGNKDRPQKHRKEGGSPIEGIGRWVGSVGQELHKAVEEGKITEKQAWERWRGFKEGPLAQKLKGAVKGGEISEQAAIGFWRGLELGEARTRLEQAVKRGEISEEDARRKMSEIEKQHMRRGEHRDKGKDHRKDRRNEHRKEGGSAIEKFGQWVGKVGDEIRKAAESDKITGEQAWAKWQEFKEKQLGPKLHAAVKEGKIPEQAAREFLRQIELAEAGEKLKQAVRDRKISEEDARKKMDEIKKKLYSHDQKDQTPNRVREHLMKVRGELGAAVRAGKISREDAAKRFAAGRDRDRARPHQAPEHAAREHLMKVRRELGAAVEAAKISREDAGKRFAEVEKAVRERIAAGQRNRGGEKDAPRRPDRVNWENIRKRIEGAVKRGDMTRKEADAKYKEIKDRMSGRHQR
ncbi:MAG: M56 family metallopeptidase [Phycisphaerae bacterium]|jgi:beta-lactamase regulating signal transducer with metallopeptidase domain/polyhydroxyalkanoate synthesis regulator phasin|nr:M56 family metallopeptidase [Phycisphaerae bacterium]